MSYTILGSEMQSALRTNTSDEEEIEEKAHAYFSHCPFCGTDYSMSYEANPDERYMFCRNCRRRWNLVYTVGTLWFIRANDSQQKKKYTSWWIIERAYRSLEGIRPYQLLETSSFSKS